MLTSSANSTVRIIHVTAALISVVRVDRYRANNNGPEIEPCCTPNVKRTILCPNTDTVPSV